MKIADISYYQGTINWELARKELDLVIFRASIGLSDDKKYQQYAKECGIPFGVYHFCKASNATAAREEAKYFYRIATSNDLAPLFFVADIEHKNQTNSNVKSIANAFCEELRTQGAKKVGLYIGQYFYPYIDPIVYDFIWIPRYGKDAGEKDEKYKPIYSCDLWQYTSRGHVDGISTNVDLNVLNSNKTLDWFLEKNKQLTKDSIKELQTFLNNNGFNCGKIDGIFGAKTKAAIESFYVSNIFYTMRELVK